MTTPARQTQLQVTHQIRFDFAFNQFGNGPVTTQALAAAAQGLGFQIGAVPAGAIIEDVKIYVDVAFNNGTTNTVSVGFTATGTDLVSAAALGTKANVLTAAPIAANATAKAQTATGGTPIFVSAVQSGTAATAGQATVVVTFHPPIG